MHQAARFSGLILLSLLLAVTVVGCKKEQHQLKFNHSFHLDMGLTCDTCHSMENGKVTRPGHDVCSSCHSDQIEAKEVNASNDSCGHCHAFKKEDMVMPEEKPVAPSPFIHTEALMNVVQCASCHAQIVNASGLAVPKVGPSARHKIMKFAHGLVLDCSTCHAGMSPNQRPPSHLSGDWKKRHGMHARLNGTETCTPCHDPVSTCDSCHRTEAPDSHTNFFRLKSHGIEASVNREKCMTCHEVDSCQRCHSTEAPISHRAGWGPPSNRHCFNCHATMGARTGCFVCHSADLSSLHPSAPPPPPTTFHRPSASCLACHGPNAGGGPPPLPRPELIRRLNPAHHAIVSQDLCIGCHKL